MAAHAVAVLGRNPDVFHRDVTAGFDGRIVQESLLVAGKSHCLIGPDGAAQDFSGI
ncbi:hypothetical protein SDC9_174468 [bioreactor metagenome]|uniref:Uncharacterized protein n=1 Tax=bioreactor metagenome TaxID=1076179 RepID=A0A645GJ92_9ZZZZ